ncbi:MAG: hypothetical protein R3D98_11430 [Candidatus Krumholzibacteriia bacterium]
MQNEQNTNQYQASPPPAAYPPLPPVVNRRDLPFKLPWLAGFLSGLFPGIGQIYVGYYRQGVVFAAVFIGLITVLAGGGLAGLEPLFGLSMGFVWLYGIIDAARRAQAVNRALEGYGNQAVPEDMPLPGSGGSFGGGVILIVLGVLLLANLKFDVDMEWLAEWWPLGLIGFGGWLVWKARTEKERSGR